MLQQNAVNDSDPPLRCTAGMDQDVRVQCCLIANKTLEASNVCFCFVGCLMRLGRRGNGGSSRAKYYAAESQRPTYSLAGTG